MYVYIYMGFLCVVFNCFKQREKKGPDYLLIILGYAREAQNNASSPNMKESSIFILNGVANRERYEGPMYAMNPSSRQIDNTGRIDMKPVGGGN